MTNGKLPYNKLCNVSDFKELAPDIADVFRHLEAPQRYRKYWEQVMQIRGLRDHGALHPEAQILGVGAGVEVTNYYLAHHVQRVTATDLYAQPGWDDYAPQDAPANPLKYAPYAYPADRLHYYDMDARMLLFEDNCFDGIYSASSIEHFGSLGGMMQAAREMARVLKPGGVLAFSTEFDINGKSGFLNGNTFIFNQDTLQACIIEPSGCVRVDAPDWDVSEVTRQTSMELGEIMRLAQTQSVPEPHIAIRANGYDFVPVSVVLCKPL